MALVKCAECGNDVATTAQACPKCGAPPNAVPPAPPAPKEKTSVLMWIGYAGAAAFLLCLGSTLVARLGHESRSMEAADRSTGRPDAFLKAADLSAAYQANEVAADQRFKSRPLRIEGKVEKIGKDITDEAYVVLEGSGRILGQVQVYFRPESMQYLAGLERGDEVVVQGECRGLMGNVLLKDSNLLIGPHGGLGIRDDMVSATSP
jgi:hypothetical protein